MRIVSPGRWPLEVGPTDRSTVWWGLGQTNQISSIRPRSMNDEFIFGCGAAAVIPTINGDFRPKAGI
ncbi:MAG: hypothetical protein IPP15_23400 [Saprospiraceae bacterium]|uniref:Uncharacterized protein n=1 Tax=Candidatus Opimibacter skivensis TaxID=2982028 RepID=A0A9D7T0C4_9BACT|nr:hypothetical protein [Candidatus Opimibacter skivensis]